MDVVLRLRHHGVALLRDGDRSFAAHFAPRRVDDARLDAIARVVAVARRLDAHDRAAVRVRLQRLRSQHRSAARKVGNVVVVPGILSPRKPVAIERLLVDDRLDGRVRDRAAEVIARVDRRFDRVAEAIELLVGRRHADLELREFVFLETEQRRVADVVVVTDLERDAIFAERHRVGESERGGEAAVRIQRRVPCGDLLVARAPDLPRDFLSGRRREEIVLARAGDDFPLHRLAGAVGRTIGEGVELPAVGGGSIAVRIRRVPRLLSFAGRRRDDDFRIVVDLLHDGDAVRIRRRLVDARLVVAPALSDAHARAGNRLAAQNVGDVDLQQ